MRFRGARECRKGEVFIEIRGGAGAWTQESKVVADTTSSGMHCYVVVGTCLEPGPTSMSSSF